MNRLRTILAIDQPQETRFFLVLGAFGIALGVVYWFVSYEAAGTALLLGFGLANGVVGAFLAADPAAARVRAAVRAQRDRTGPDPAQSDVAAGGTGGIDRPYLDESGRIPADSLAPFAVGLGVATTATATIFGAAMVVAGLVPLAWGAWQWLSRARAELQATEATAGRAGTRAVRPPPSIQMPSPDARRRRRRSEPADGAGRDG